VLRLQQREDLCSLQAVAETSFTAHRLADTSDGQISNPNLTLKSQIFETQIPNPKTKI